MKNTAIDAHERDPNGLPVSCVLIGLALSAVLVQAGEPSPVLDREGGSPQPIIAVENVCAWPNLTLLPEGAIAAVIHNQPSHLKQPADCDCWISIDGGKSWEKRGTPAPRDNETVARGNVAAGVDREGNLVVVASGWSDPAASSGRGTILPPLVSRSSDGGRTWHIDHDAFPDSWPQAGRRKSSPEGYLVPFGDVLPGADGTLRVGLYGGEKGAAFVFRSDDGRTWRDPVPFNPEAEIHEPALVHLGEGHWLMAARRNGLDLYTSEDDGRTWTHRQRLTGSQQHPGHLFQLTGGRVLLSYGNRNDPRGVDVRISDDRGKTWSEPRRVVAFQGDGGYPASVQRSDGQIVTAYYARRVPDHNRYHMGVVIWDAAKTWNASR